MLLNFGEAEKVRLGSPIPDMVAVPQFGSDLALVNRWSTFWSGIWSRLFSSVFCDELYLFVPLENWSESQ